MAVSEQEMQAWCETLLAGRAAAPDLTLADYLRRDSRPRPRSTMCRAARPCSSAATSTPSRAPRSATATSASARWSTLCSSAAQRGWKQIVFGHIGRKPEGSLAKVAKRLGELLECDVPLIGDWLDEASMTILPSRQRTDRRGRSRAR